jgi:hypothetical protein
MNVKVKALNKAEIAAMFNKPKMSDGEKAARLYLGRKQTERELRIDRVFIAIWACLAIAALAAPFILFWGV